jgi:hypothetical protein
MSLQASTDLPFVGAGLLPLSLEGLRPAVAAWQRMTAITALSLRRLGIDNVSDDLAFTGGEHSRDGHFGLIFLGAFAATSIAGKTCRWTDHAISY